MTTTIFDGWGKFLVGGGEVCCLSTLSGFVKLEVDIGLVLARRSSVAAEIFDSTSPHEPPHVSAISPAKATAEWSRCGVMHGSAMLTKRQL